MLQLDETSLLVHAEAGLTGLELERILAPRNLSIGDYPPVVLTSSVGGLIAVRTPGKSSARHGFFEEAVVGVSAVLADGRTVHTRVAPRRAIGPLFALLFFDATFLGLMAGGLAVILLMVSFLLRLGGGGTQEGET